MFLDMFLDEDLYNPFLITDFGLGQLYVWQLKTFVHWILYN